MQRQCKNLINQCAPPIAARIVSHLLSSHGSSSNTVRVLGNYSSWDEARAHSTGYDAKEILDKVRDATIMVRDGKAAYERDSVVFDKVAYSFPVVAGLLRIALLRYGSLSVLDYGGSLGSTYFQCRGFLGGVGALRWSVVEQRHFVDCGRELIENDVIRFYYDIDECLSQEKPDVILLSGVLQYLRYPHDFLQIIVGHNLEHIIIDRTHFIQICRIVPKLAPDLLTVQIVPPSIYDGSYPAWFFDEQHFLAHFEGHYRTITEFDSLESYDLSWLKARSKGYIMERS